MESIEADKLFITAKGKLFTVRINLFINEMYQKIILPKKLPANGTHQKATNNTSANKINIETGTAIKLVAKKYTGNW